MTAQQSLVAAARQRTNSHSCRRKMPPLRALAENIPLDIVYEDDDLAVINKAAGMMVHAGAGATESERNRGTLVNALFHRFGQLSGVGGELRPGIVHRLDKATSGLIVVAKNDDAHRKLAAQFARRVVKKKYIALVHGWIKQDRGTISSSISRDRVRRTRMTTQTLRRARSHHTLHRATTNQFGLWKIHSVGAADRYWANPPDPGASGLAATSGGGRHAIRRTPRTDCQKPVWYFSSQKFSPRGGVAVAASSEC